MHFFEHAPRVFGAPQPLDDSALVAAARGAAPPPNRAPPPPPAAPSSSDAVDAAWRAAGADLSALQQAFKASSAAARGQADVAAALASARRAGASARSCAALQVQADTAAAQAQRLADAADAANATSRRTMRSARQLELRGVHAPPQSADELRARAARLSAEADAAKAACLGAEVPRAQLDAMWALWAQATLAEMEAHAAADSGGDAASPPAVAVPAAAAEDAEDADAEARLLASDSKLLDDYEALSARLLTLQGSVTAALTFGWLSPEQKVAMRSLAEASVQVSQQISGQSVEVIALMSRLVAEGHTALQRPLPAAMRQQLQSAMACELVFQQHVHAAVSAVWISAGRLQQTVHTRVKECGEAAAAHAAAAAELEALRSSGRGARNDVQLRAARARADRLQQCAAAASEAVDAAEQECERAMRGARRVECGGKEPPLLSPDELCKRTADIHAEVVRAGEALTAANAAFSAGAVDSAALKEATETMWAANAQLCMLEIELAEIAEEGGASGSGSSGGASGSGGVSEAPPAAASVAELQRVRESARADTAAAALLAEEAAEKAAEEARRAKAKAKKQKKKGGGAAAEAAAAALAGGAAGGAGVDDAGSDAGSEPEGAPLDAPALPPAAPPPPAPPPPRPVSLPLLPPAAAPAALPRPPPPAPRIPAPRAPAPAAGGSDSGGASASAAAPHSFLPPWVGAAPSPPPPTATQASRRYEPPSGPTPPPPSNPPAFSFLPPPPLPPPPSAFPPLPSPLPTAPTFCGGGSSGAGASGSGSGSAARGAASASAAPAPPVVPIRRECCVCLDASSPEALMALYPCGHRCCCAECADKLLRQARPCPKCRAPLQGAMRVYDD
jgi:hypothetical protein